MRLVGERGTGKHPRPLAEPPDQIELGRIVEGGEIGAGESGRHELGLRHHLGPAPQRGHALAWAYWT